MPHAQIKLYQRHDCTARPSIPRTDTWQGLKAVRRKPKDTSRMSNGLELRNLSASEPLPANNSLVAATSSDVCHSDKEKTCRGFNVR
jgi:hypothetical protein